MRRLLLERRAAGGHAEHARLAALRGVPHALQRRALPVHASVFGARGRRRAAAVHGGVHARRARHGRVPAVRAAPAASLGVPRGQRDYRSAGAALRRALRREVSPA